MDYYAGIDVSLELSSVCILDASGQIVREAKVASEPEALATFLAGLNLPLTRVGLEAGPLSQWLHAGLVQAGFEVVLLEDPACEGGTLGHDRQDRPPRRSRHRPVAAHGLVPPRPLQVAAGAGSAGPAYGSQAAAGQDARC